MPETFYPAVNSILSVDRLPDPVKDIINKVGSKLFYKTYYVEKSKYGDVAYHYINLVFNNDVGFNLFGGDEGFELLFNPGQESGTTELPLAIYYNLPILKYTNSLSINDLGSPKEYFNIIIQIFKVSEGALLLQAINSIFEFSIPGFVDHFNNNPNYSSYSPITSDYSGNDDEIVSGIIAQLKAQGIDVYLYVLEEIIAVENDVQQSLDNLYTVFKDIMGSFTFEDLLKLFIPQFSVSIQELEAALAFPRTWLLPLNEDGSVIEGDTKSLLRYNAGSLTYDSAKGFEFNGVDSFSLDKSQIGNTGLIIEIEKLKLDLRDDSNIPEAIADGRPDNFKGVYAQLAAITLPKRWFPNQEPDTTARIAGYDILIGTGGFSGTLALEAIGSSDSPKLEKRIGGENGFTVFFSAFDITFKQNKVTGSNIKGGLIIPRLKDANGNDAEVEIFGHFDDSGDFLVSASEKDGFKPFGFEDTVMFQLKTVGLGSENGKFFLECSCDILLKGDVMKNLIGEQPIQIQKMRIYSDGSFEILGGTIPVPSNLSLDLGPVKVAITNINIGSYQEDGRKYMVIGFDGGIDLGSLGFEARGKGMQYYFTIDGKDFKHEFRIQTIEADLIIPGGASPSAATAIINGYLSIPQPGVSKEYSGKVSVNLPKVQVSGSAEFRLQPKYPAFIVDASIEIPRPIPIVGAMSISGFRGLIGFRYIADMETVNMSKSKGDTWYDYYKYPELGVNLKKFNGPDKSEKAKSGFSLGAGATLVSADGNMLSARLMFILSIPSVFIFDGKANILSEALDLDDRSEPPFFAALIIDSSSLELGAGVKFKTPRNSGKLITIDVSMQAYFPFGNSSAWYIHVGSKRNPNEARIFDLITMLSYLELSAKGMELGARADFDFNKKFGPAKVEAWLYAEVGGKVSFERPQIGGYIAAGGGAKVKFWIVTVGVSVNALFGAEVPKPFRVYASFKVSASVKFAFVRISKSIKVELKWEKEKRIDTSPILPLPDNLVNQNIKGISMLTGEAFNLYKMAATTKPTTASFKNNAPILPLDTYVDIKFQKPVDPTDTKAKIGGVRSRAEGSIEMIPPLANLKGRSFRQVKHKYSLKEIKVQAWNGTAWVDYNPYEAIVEDGINVTGLKMGYWQKTGAEYNAIRILGDTPFSYTQRGQSGTFIPEQMGISSNSLFCENTDDFYRKANWRNRRIGTRYPHQLIDSEIRFDDATGEHIDNMFSNNGLSFAVLSDNYLTSGNQGVTDYAKVGFARSENFNFSRGLEFNNANPLVLKYNNPSRFVRFKMTTGALGVTFIFYRSTFSEASSKVIFEEFDRVYQTSAQIEAEAFEYSSDLAENTISMVKIVPSTAKSEEIAQVRTQLEDLYDLAIDGSIVTSSITDKEMAQIEALLAQLDILEAQGCRKVLVSTTGIGSMEITFDFIVGKDDLDSGPVSSTICETVLFEAGWLTEFDAELKRTIPNQAAISADHEAAVRGITQVVEPIWRPDTQYRIEFTLTDTVQADSVKENSWSYYYGFATAGPVGHFEPNINYNDYTKTSYVLDLDQEIKDKYAHTTLRQYLDYKRSYPNADGNLLLAKPLFYGTAGGYNEISLYYVKAYAYHMFRNWPEYKGVNGPLLESGMEVIVKDPSEDITLSNPPESIIVKGEIPASSIDWSDDTNYLFPKQHQLYNNLANSNENCIVGDSKLIIPKRKITTVTVINMRPQKMYTAIVNSKYKGLTKEVHNFVFQTSRYLDFNTQINSFLLKNPDNNEVLNKAIFTLDIEVNDSDLKTAYNIVAGNAQNDATSQFLESDKLDFFDRAVEGALRMPAMDPAATTEFNFIKNTLTGDIIGMLIRNPEPFNDPKIELEVIDGTKNKNNQGFAVMSGNTVDKDYKILYAKDYSQILVMYNMNNKIAITAENLAMKFNYLLWKGESYEKHGSSVSISINVNKG